MPLHEANLVGQKTKLIELRSCSVCTAYSSQKDLECGITYYIVNCLYLKQNEATCDRHQYADYSEVRHFGFTANFSKF